MAVSALSYGASIGYEPLRKFLLEKHSNTCIQDPDVLISSGAEEGIDLVSKLFLLNGPHSVMVENPTFMGAISTISVYNPEIVGFDLSIDFDMDQIDSLLARYNPKFVYLIPNFPESEWFSIYFGAEKRISEIIPEI